MTSGAWISAVQWSIWGLAMTLVMGWVARSRNRKRGATDAKHLGHPSSTLVIGLVCAGFFAGLAIVSNVWSNKTTTIWTTLTFVGFALLSLPMIADYWFARHAVSDEGMEYGRMFGQRGSFLWSEVKQVRYAPGMKWFKIDLQSGTRVRVSAMLYGLPEFARLALQHVPSALIDETTRAVLKATADGSPPNIWG